MEPSTNKTKMHSMLLQMKELLLSIEELKLEETTIQELLQLQSLNHLINILSIII